MNRPPLFSESIPRALHDRIRAYVARLPESVQARLAAASPEQAAAILYESGAFGPTGGLGGAPPGLGWINFVIQAAMAAYSYKKGQDEKKKIAAQQAKAEREARIQAAAEAAAAAKAEAAAMSIKKSQESITAASATNWKKIGLIGGGVVVGLGLLFFLKGKRK